MYPLKFKPILKTVVWGGEKIAPFKHIETDQHHIGESWELSGVAGNESIVANGAWKGRSIADLVREYKGRLVGQHVYDNTGNQFPLLIHRRPLRPQHPGPSERRPRLCPP